MGYEPHRQLAAANDHTPHLDLPNVTDVLSYFHVIPFAANIIAFIKGSYKHLIHFPLLYLYLTGPRIQGILGIQVDYGGWASLPTHDICAFLTSQPSQMFLNHPEDCEALILNRVFAVEIGVMSILYFYTLYKLYGHTTQALYQGGMAVYHGVQSLMSAVHHYIAA
jgi:hypothetical protein